jgi:DNA-3-methyladenine glycosylase
MKHENRLTRNFFTSDVLEVAPALPGKILVVKYPDGIIRNLTITEVEAYKGSEDEACHAFRGRTKRTEVMFHEGGRLYVYLIYGMYWMLNVVTGNINDPQAVLIRGVENYSGPGKLTKALGINGTYNGEDIVVSDRIWIEDAGYTPVIKTGPRIGIEYAGETWKKKPWRFYTA